MDHRAPRTHVRIPLLGRVRVGLVLTLAGLALFLVTFLLTLVPLWLAHQDAKKAEDELKLANKALTADEMGNAQEELASARHHVDDAQGHLNGLAADLWSQLPVIGPAVKDGRHLVAALDQATTAGTVGVNLLADATSPDSQLIRGHRVSIHQVRRLSTRAQTIAPHLQAAQSEISEVTADDPLVGNKIASLKRNAVTQLASTQAAYEQFRPLLDLFDTLPRVLGAKGPRTYLVTIMNPAEQRFSGGATLQMSTLHFHHGTLTFGGSQSVADVDQARPFLNWSPVRGNVFHPPGPRRLTAATYSPWWQVSGEELLRAWQAQTGQRCEGLIAVDLQALASLFRITGPIQVPGYGELNADNLVRTLAGSYGRFENPHTRRRLNTAIVPAFQQKLLGGGAYIQKARSLLQDAQGRHLAIYFRDPSAQRAFAAAGFAGNLSTSPNDYLGVFSQNLNGSKSDYWQTRHVTSHVTLHPDGSASERVNVVVRNPAPPYVGLAPDPRTGYDTRWLGTWVGVFLPPDSRLVSASADGRPLAHASLEQPSTDLPGVLDRPFLRHSFMLAPQKSGRLSVEYEVPRAAVTGRAGNMSYQVHIDPQDLVQPQSNLITLTIPPGYRFGPLAHTGWTLRNEKTASLRVPELTHSSSWRLLIYKK